MDDNFNEQKDILVSIKKEISLLHQQVDYLIRNEKPLELLDLDVMMNRTHKIYDLMCGVEVESEELGMRNEELGMRNEEEVPEEMDDAIRSLFGIETQEETPEEKPIEEETIEESFEEELQPVEEEEEEPVEEETIEEEPVEEDESAYFIEEVDDVEDVKEGHETQDFETQEDETPEEEPVEEIEPEEEPGEEPKEEENKKSDDFGFILNFEPIEGPAEESKTSVYTTGDEIEMEIPHLDFPEEETPEDEEEGHETQDFETREDEAPEEEIPEEESFEEEKPVEEEIPEEETLDEIPEEEIIPEEETSEEETLDEIPEEEIIPEEVLEEEKPEEEPLEEDTPHSSLLTPHSQDSLFETETLGDRLQQGQDPTLADKLQHSTVKSLRNAIGINDKFLFVNELFNGSMEKYNRSIENLDDLKTLNGALIYLNELRIELQWNSSNEAYQKLLELVHRKFEA